MRPIAVISRKRIICSGLRVVCINTTPTSTARFSIPIGLFCALYGAVAYLVIQSSGIYVLEGTLLFIVGGVSAAASLTQAIRIRTDQLYLLRKWILEDLKVPEDKEQYLRSLVEKISVDVDSVPSRKALLILRELALKGGKHGGLVQLSVTLSTLERKSLMSRKESGRTKIVVLERKVTR